MRVPQPDIIEHFGNADAVPQLSERCLSRKAGIVRCCLRVAGLFRVAGVLGLPADRGSFPFAFFLFFFEGRMSHALIDKRYTENCAKAQLTVDISRTVEAPIEAIFIFE